MTEAGHTSSQYFGLNSPIGCSRKLFAGLFQIDDGETLDTGLDTIEACHFQSQADVAAAYHIGGAISISGGVITTSVGAVADYTDDNGKNYYAIVIGSKR